MTISRQQFSLALLFSITLPTTALATNGYFTHGISTAEKGLAGAGAAYSQDSLAAANNPAGMVWQGSRYDVGAAIFAPMRNYSSEGTPSAPVGAPCGFNCPFSIGDGDQNIDSENESFLIPHFGYNRMLDDDSSIGLSVYGNGGMNTEYKDGVALLGPTGVQAQFPGTYGDDTAGVDLSQLFITTTYAAKISASTSWGVSGIIAYQKFEAKGLSNFAGYSTDPANLSNNNHDSSSGIGIRLGIQSEVSPGIRVGAAFQPEIDMGEFDDYAGLFAEEGDFNIPSTFTIGLAFDVGQDGVFVIDVQKINYGDVDAIANPIANLVPANGLCTPGATGGTGDGCLGGDDGAGFGWEDMTVVKLGYQWRDGDWTWRVGYSTTDQPISDDEVLFNILAPGVIEEHMTFGFTRNLDADSSIGFAAMIAPSNSVSGTNTFDPGQEIELEMDQYELVLSYNRRL